MPLAHQGNTCINMNFERRVILKNYVRIIFKFIILEITI